MFIGLTILSLVAAVICGTASRIWEQRDDPLAPELLRLGQNPQAAVEYFAPDGQLDSNGHWMPGPSSQARWEHLRSRTWRASGYDALTSAVEAASSPRANETGDTTNERAAWATGRGISLLAARETDYSPPAKQHIGTILANSIREVRETAASGSLMDSRGDLSGDLVTPYDENAPTPITENIGEEIIQLTKIAGSDDSALHTMVEEVRRTSQSNTRAVLESEPGAVVSDSATLDKMLYVSLKDDGQVLGFIYESAIITRTGQTSAAMRTASPSGSDPKGVIHVGFTSLFCRVRVW